MSMADNLFIFCLFIISLSIICIINYYLYLRFIGCDISAESTSRCSKGTIYVIVNHRRFATSFV